MDVNAELNTAFRRLIDGRLTVTLFPATVMAFSSTQRTVEVEDADGMMLYDVLLTPVSGSGNSKVFLQPAIGSIVLVGNVGNSPNRYEVVACSQIDKARAIIGTKDIEISAQGLKVQFGEDSLKTVLNDLIDQVTFITVATPAGPSGTPNNAVAITALKARLNNLLY